MASLSSNFARALIVLSLILSLATQVTTEPAAANAANGGLVPEVPRTDTPQILDGRMRSIEQVGSRVIAGGTFEQVSPSPGDAPITQPHLIAFDMATGDMDMSFLPDLDGDVLVVEPGDVPNTVFVGGKFKSVNGQNYKGIVKLNTTNGQIITSFKANTPALVSEIHLADGKLYIGGDFKKVKGQPRLRLAALDPTTGALDPDFIMPLGEAPAWPRSPLVRLIEKLPGNRLLVVHRSNEVGGFERWGSAILNVSSPVPTVTPWEVNDFWSPKNKVPIFGVDVSPDGSYFVTTTSCSDYPPQCDTATAFPTSGGANVEPLWVTRLHDSTYSVAIADNAVYVGGHFCQSESMTAPDPWGGDGVRDYSCYSNRFDRENAAMLFGDDIDIRRQLAALDPSNGKTIVGWNPESNALNGVTVLTLVDNGLIVGHDGMHVGGRKTGRVAVLDRNQNRDLDNIALFATATANSQNPMYPPKRAIDGTRRGNYELGFGMRTNSATNPWLELDLGSIEPLKKIKLFNRTDCCNNGLTNISVFVSDAPFTSTNPANLFNHPAVSHYPLGAAALGRVTDVPVNRTGRYVRIQMVGAGVMQLAEVEVIRAAGVDTTKPTGWLSSPTAGETLPVGQNTITGTASDNVKVKRIAVSIKNRVTKQYLRQDGTWGGYQQLDVNSNQAAFTPWDVDVSLPAGSYRIVYRAVDSNGNKQALEGINFTVN